MVLAQAKRKGNCLLITYAERNMPTLKFLVISKTGVQDLLQYGAKRCAYFVRAFEPTASA